MPYQKSPPRKTILAACAVIATVAFAAPANAAPTITLDRGVLTIDGDAQDNVLVVGSDPAGFITLNGSVILGGTATLDDVTVVRMDGADGNDTLRLDESGGVAMPAGKLVGGRGNDKLTGGSQVDRLVGGGGIDRIDSAPGDDIVTMGDDADQFTWNPGDGDDQVDGDAGKDTLIFNGADRTAADLPFESEAVQFDSDRSRTTIRWLLGRDFPLPSPENTVSVSGFELVKARLAGGPNAVFFADTFSGSDVGVVKVDLGPPTDPVRDRQARNNAAFVGSEGGDRIRLGGSPTAGATVTGLGPTAIITGAQVLTVQGAGGDDVIDAGLLAKGTVGLLHEVGGADEEPGNDTLIGHPGSDELHGGGGNDRIEGRGGSSDILDGGPGNNVIIP